MKKVPEIKKENGVFSFCINGKTELLLGGEIHNSSGSDSVYMEKHVWPVLKKLGGNFYLVPAYWENIEPEEGRYDFSLLDNMIHSAREAGVHLGLLWFGIWKGPDSLYIPMWLKKELQDEDFQRDADHKLIRQLSPFADNIVEKDIRAYSRLVEHVKEIDAEEQTVIIMQIENEPGTWFHKRDFSKRAEKAFNDSVPDEVQKAFRVSGTWKEAFKDNAEEMFMCWAVSGVVNRVAQAGKDIYSLPTFTNCVPQLGFMHVAGGPAAENADAWKKLAPAVDVLTPNVYDRDYERIILPYRREDNALMIPETGMDKNLVSKLLFAVGSGCLMYSPFGIERIFETEEDEYKARLLGNPLKEKTGERLRDAYGILFGLYPEILKGLEEKTVYAMIQGPDEKSNIPVPGFGGMVQFMDGDSRQIRMGDYLFTLKIGYSREPEEAPLASAVILQKGNDKFLFIGINLCLEVSSAFPEETVFTEDLREYVLRDGKLEKGRILNGDERNAIAAGEDLTVLQFTLSRHR